MKTLKIEHLKITDDHTLLDKENNITPYIASLLEKLYFEIPKGKEKTLKKLLKYTNKFSNTPVFKNYLMTYYADKGNDEKVNEINKWIIKEHPNYLYAKINYATTLVNENKFEEVKQILGESLLLHELLPHRKEFLFDEIISYYTNTIQFLYTIEETDEADNRLDILKEIDENHPKIEQIENFKLNHFFTNISLLNNDDALDDGEHYIDELARKKRSKLQTNTPPKFNHPKEINYLYTNTTESITSEQLNELLNLDNESLTDDLIKVLYDSIYRFDYFTENDKEENEFDFPLHAFYLLIYLKNEKSLEVVFDLLRQDNDYNEFWFGDLFFECTGSLLSLLGKNNKNRLISFIKEDYVGYFNKNTAMESFMKLTDFSNSNDRKKTITQLNDLIDFLIENRDNPAIGNMEFNSFFVAELIDYGITELLPKIKKLYDLEIVHIDYSGTFDEIKEDIKNPESTPKTFNSFNTITEVYQNFKTEDNFDYDFLEEDIESKSSEPLISKEKIGRNDPCFCGSGKKHKKCCINL